LRSVGITADGTTSSADLFEVAQSDPRRASASGAGYARQLAGSLESSISVRETVSEMSAGMATRSLGAMANSRLTKYSRAASESVADV
jgi:hypothetical protein